MALDDIAINKMKLPLLSMMENAGKSLAVLAKQMLNGAKNKTIVCLIGTGHNGGGALVAARHLSNWGAKIHLVLGGNIEKLREATRVQFNILQTMETEYSHKPPLQETDLILDGLLGYRGKGDPREPLASLINYANDDDTPILALDIPSGLDPDSGKPNNPCIRAKRTLTLALPKTGLIAPGADRFVGRLYLADIGIPRVVYQEVTGMDLNEFFETALVDLSKL